MVIVFEAVKKLLVKGWGPSFAVGTVCGLLLVKSSIRLDGSRFFL